MSEENQRVQIDYVKLTSQQAEVVDDLARKVKKTKDPKQAQQLEVEMEALAFYRTAAKGDPRARAAKVIETARSTVIGRAVV